MTLNNVHDLFEHKLLAVLASEKRIVEMLEDAASEAKEPKLREAFEHHRKETLEQVKRVEDVFETLQRRPRNVDPSVVEGLVEEKRRFLHEDPTPEVLDVFNLSAGIKTEHIEIAAYEDLINLAAQMGAEEVAEPLRKNLEEEKATLEKLMRFATDGTLSTPKRSEAPEGQEGSGRKESKGQAETKGQSETKGQNETKGQTIIRQ